MNENIKKAPAVDPTGKSDASQNFSVGKYYHTNTEEVNHSKFIITAEDRKAIKETLLKEGWKCLDAGYHCVENVFIPYTHIEIYYKCKKHDNGTFVTVGGCGDKGEIEKPSLSQGKNRGENDIYGPKDNNSPQFPPKDRLPTHWTLVESFQRLREGLSDSLVIGFDTEFQTGVRDGFSYILTWQFVCRWNGYDHTFVFLTTCDSLDDQISADPKINSRRDSRLLLKHSLAIILRYLHYCDPVDLRNLYCWECIVDDPNGRKLPKIKSFKRKSDAVDAAVYQFDSAGKATMIKIHSDTPLKLRVKRVIDVDVWKAHSVYITIVSHFGLADWSGIGISDRRYVMRGCSSVQGGLVSMFPMKLICNSVDESVYRSAYCVNLIIRDTMGHSAGGQKSLDSLGDSCGRDKIDIEKAGYDKTFMIGLLKDDPSLFFDYAANDPWICVDYLGFVYGYNKTPPLTMVSGFTKASKAMLMDYLNCSVKDFSKIFRGTYIVDDGLLNVADLRQLGKPKFIKKERELPLNADVCKIQTYAELAFSGGFNQCMMPGYYPHDTFDYDIKSAYPSAQGIIADVDWENPIHACYRDPMGELLTLTLRPWEVFTNSGKLYEPNRLIFADVREFEFPRGVKFPTIPVRIDGIMVYPRTYKDKDGKCLSVAGPNIFLALKLGATVKVKELIILNPRFVKINGNTEDSRSIGYAVGRMIADRRLVANMCGKKSLPELCLKLGCNSTYGKTAQNVHPKNSYNARLDDWENIGPSAITNSVTACYTTDLIRCVLQAAQNQLTDMGYHVYSTTTDGMISDAPESVVQNLDLYGFKAAFLTGADRTLGIDHSRTLWEIKHNQKDLLNFTTRGNLSLSSDGVCAHAGVQSPHEKDSYDDRAWLWHEVITRTKKIFFSFHEFINFIDIMRCDARDFYSYETDKNNPVDFDLKRKPNKDSFKSVYVPSPIDHQSHENVNFETDPFEDIDEYKQYRNVARACQALRTMADWDRFYKALDDVKNGRRISKGSKTSLDSCKDPDWEIIWSCVVKHRQLDDKYKITAISNFENTYGGVQKILDFLNQKCFLGDSKRQFSRNDWKEARRPERLKTVLPDCLTDNLMRLLQRAAPS